MRLENSLTAVLPEDWQNGGFGLYVHWPYCAAKCPYCDFNSHVAAVVDEKAWERAYLSEIKRFSDETGPRVLNSIFFGGGTPSLMSPDLVANVITKIRSCWPVANDIEITLEANPGSVEAGRFAGYAEAGVTRISMGVQALNDADLRRLGRIHTVQEARAAFDIARDAFDRVSFDLIYARQDQTVTQWKAELREALSMAVDHLSLYQLTIEPGTAFGDRYARGGLRGLPRENDAAEMYEITQEICDANGMPAYEVSNHAKPGAESVHNRIYWRYGDYVGIGPGAHGRLTLGSGRFATETVLNPIAWLKAAENGSGENVREALTAQDQATEFLLMGMRLVEGIDPDRYRTISGSVLAEEKLQMLRDHGLIEVGERVRATARGRAVLNSVIAEMLPN